MAKKSKKLKYLIDGAEVWKMHATHGIAIETTIPELAEKGYVPTWDKLLNAAMQDGTDIPQLVRRLQGIAVDSYPPKFAKVVQEKLPWLIGKTNESI